MKKTLLLFAAMFAGIGLTTAQTLSIPDVYVPQGGKASFGLVVDVPANSYAGFQFETTLPTGITYTEETTVSSAWDGTFQTSSVNFHGSASSGKLTPIPAGEFVIATAEITADGGLALGTYSVTISNFEFLGYSGGAEDTKIADVTFNVIVTDGLVLDEASVAAPSAASGVNVKVKRTIKAGEWSTICLPFDMTKEQVYNIFGDDVKIYYFDSYVTEKNGSDITGITVNLEEDDLSEGFTKNYPYVIKTTKNITEFNIDNVDVDPDAIDEVYKPSKKVLGHIYGTYEANTIVPENNLFLADGKFYYSKGLTKMKAFRCYFDFVDVLSSVSGSPAPVFINIDGETTGIQNIQIAGDDRYYNLNGQHVENLKKGQIYIKNNKKVVVK